MPNCFDLGFGHGEWAVWPIPSLSGGAIVVSVTSAPVKGEKMNEAIGSSNTWKTTATVLVAVLVLLVVALVSMLQPTPTNDAGTPAVHPGVHAASTGGQGFAEDPYVGRHTEVVAGYQQGDPR
jgi:hypothetical protein